MMQYEEAAPEHSLEQRMLLFRRQRRRTFQSIFLMSLVMVVIAWFVWSLRAELSYVFSSAHKSALVQGNVVLSSPAKLIPNTYVEIEGITEHRGLSQKSMRSLSLRRENFWYFRLAGSQGVFVEVPAQGDKYGIGRFLDVKGRVVDLRADKRYAELLSFYVKSFPGKQGDALRLVQVGWRPGEGRLSYILLLGLFSFVVCFNLYQFFRLGRIERPHILAQKCVEQ